MVTGWLDMLTLTGLIDLSDGWELYEWGLNVWSGTNPCQ